MSTRMQENDDNMKLASSRTIETRSRDEYWKVKCGLSGYLWLEYTGHTAKNQQTILKINSTSKLHEIVFTTKKFPSM